MQNSEHRKADAAKASNNPTSTFCFCSATSKASTAAALYVPPTNRGLPSSTASDQCSSNAAHSSTLSYPPISKSSTCPSAVTSSKPSNNSVSSTSTSHSGSLATSLPCPKLHPSSTVFTPTSSRTTLCRLNC